MGVITAFLGAASAYLGVRLAARSLHLISYAFTAYIHFMLALGRVVCVLYLPPGSEPYSGPTTWWHVIWRLVTLAPLRALFVPDSFARSYALLVVPAFAVWLVACLAMLFRSPLAAELLSALRTAWRRVLGLATCLVSALLADDAVRRYLLPGRFFPATLRASVAVLLGFLGLVGTLGPPDSGGLSTDQVLEWLLALGRMSITAIAGVGGGVLLHRAATMSLYYDAAAAAGGISELDDRLPFLVYGSFLSLVAVAAAARLEESGVLGRVLVGVVRLADGLLRVRPLLAALARWARWVEALPPVRSVTAAGRRADVALTGLLTRSGRRTIAAARSVYGTVRLGLGPLVLGFYRSVLTPVGRSGLAAGRAAVSAVRAIVIAAYRRVLVPSALASWHAARATYRLLLLPLAAAAGTLLRRHLAPVLWPLGAVTGTWWFGRQALVQRAVLPYGAAAYVSALIVALMAGKAMRKTRYPPISRAGASLESLAATAYLHLDLGAGRVVAAALTAAIAAATLVIEVALATGRELLALVVGPLFALLAAVGTALSRVVELLVRALSPWVRAGYRALSASATAVWAHPEWSLVLSAAAVGAAYVAHQAGLSAAAWRLAMSLGAAAAAAVVRLLVWLLAPLMRLLAALAYRMLVLLGVSTGASSHASFALASWGRRAATDVSSLFESRSFSTAFLALNVFHALLLKGWAVAVLGGQGAAGRAAVTPVISFVARSTGKVALGPMYVTAIAACLTGDRAGGLAARLASLTAPALWLVYLMVMWVEGARRVKLSYDPRSDSEFAQALRAIRDANGRSTRRLRSQLGYVEAAETPAPAPAGVASPATPAATPLAAPWAIPTAPAIPDAVAKHFSAVERGLLTDILAQGPPSHVFPADSCCVCFGELAAPGDAAASAQVESSAHGGRGELGPAGQGRELGAPADSGDEEAVQVLRCGHTFHLSCVLLWLQRNPRCPVCREPAVGRSRHSNMLF